MIQKRFDQIEKADIDALVTDEVQESRTGAPGLEEDRTKKERGAGKRPLSEAGGDGRRLK